jgi:D-3-phosphoglycerate dehydrogenase
LVGHPKVVATPHIAFASTASVLELRRRSAEEVVRVLTGQ